MVAGTTYLFDVDFSYTLLPDSPSNPFFVIVEPQGTYSSISEILNGGAGQVSFTPETSGNYELFIDLPRGDADYTISVTETAPLGNVETVDAIASINTQYSLTLDMPFAGTLGRQDDEYDWLSVELDAGQSYYFNLAGGGATNINIYDENGDPVVVHNVSGQLYFYPEESGSYFVSVTATQYLATEYELLVETPVDVTLSMGSPEAVFVSQDRNATPPADPNVAQFNEISELETGQSVIALSDGTFLVVERQDVDDGQGALVFQLFGTIIGADGTVLVTDTRSDDSPYAADLLDMTELSDGTIAVVCGQSGGFGRSVKVVMIDPDTLEATNDGFVSSDPGYIENEASITALNNGGFAVAMFADTPTASQGIQLVTFDADGVRQSEVFVSETRIDGVVPRIETLEDGNLLIIWGEGNVTDFADFNAGGLIGQIFSPNGSPIGEPFFAGNDVSNVTIEINSDQTFTVNSWNIQGGNTANVFAIGDLTVIEPEPEDPPDETPDHPPVGTPGNDVFDGTDGPDEFSGGAGMDVISGGAGDDDLFGGSGQDRITGGRGDDNLAGGADNDSLTGGAGADRIFGGSGHDRMNGGRDNDFLNGGGGNDTLSGVGGSDTLKGGKGHDTLKGGKGDDVLKGDKGNDTLKGGKGDDTLKGGAGYDKFVFGKKDGSDTIKDFDIDYDVIRIQSGANDFSDLTVTQSGSDAVITFANTTITIDDLDVTDVTADIFLF